jgi:hypothetical protein
MSRLMVTWRGCTVLRFSTASEHDSKMGIRVDALQSPVTSRSIFMPPGQLGPSGLARVPNGPQI